MPLFEEFLDELLNDSVLRFGIRDNCGIPLFEGGF